MPLFFLMIRVHPRSTLFPYPTLCRSPQHHEAAGGDLAGRVACAQVDVRQQPLAPAGPALDRQHHQVQGVPGLDLRSEEHTSELQSRQYIVCRLLIEKKQTETSALEQE